MAKASLQRQRGGLFAGRTPTYLIVFARRAPGPIQFGGGGDSYHATITLALVRTCSSCICRCMCPRAFRELAASLALTRPVSEPPCGAVPARTVEQMHPSRAAEWVPCGKRAGAQQWRTDRHLVKRWSRSVPSLLGLPTCRRAPLPRLPCCDYSIAGRGLQVWLRLLGVSEVSHLHAGCLSPFSQA